MDKIHEMLEAIRTGNITAVQSLLHNNSALANARDDTGDSALLLALYHKHEDIVKLLLGHKPHINIFEAAALGDIQRINELLREYPELATAHSHDGFTALHLAAFFNHPEAVELLLKNHADVNAVTKNQTVAPHATPLHSAAAAGNTRIVEMLLNAGALIDAKQRDGYTALHSAVLNNNKDMVMLLLDRHANTHARLEDGRSAMGLAKEKGFDLIVTILERHHR